jgi:hypothetical protein
MNKAPRKRPSHRAVRRKAAQHSNESLVAAAQTIGSTLGMMVAKVKGAGELAAGTGRNTAKVASSVGSRVRRTVRTKAGVRRKSRKSK